MKKIIFSYELTPSRQDFSRALGLFLLRASVGLMMAFSHGLGKIQTYFNSEVIKFPDPLGLGPDISLLMAGGTEFIMSLLLVIGFATRLACVPLIFTMLVAVFVIHGGHPFDKMEPGLLYLFPYIGIALLGPGKFSLDYIFSKK